MSGSSLPPTVAGFTSFIRNVMGVNVAALPDNAPAINWAYQVALSVVNLDLAQVPGMPGLPSIYAQAVYNLGGDNLIVWAPDQQGSQYFAMLREDLKITTFVPGVIASSADEGTSESLTVPEFMKNFTLSDLQSLKTPFGRQYLAIAQRYGTLWGIS